MIVCSSTRLPSCMQSGTKSVVHQQPERGGGARSFPSARFSPMRFCFQGANLFLFLLCLPPLSFPSIRLRRLLSSHLPLTVCSLLFLRHRPLEVDARRTQDSVCLPLHMPEHTQQVLNQVLGQTIEVSERRKIIKFIFRNALCGFEGLLIQHIQGLVSINSSRNSAVQKIQPLRRLFLLFICPYISRKDVCFLFLMRQHRQHPPQVVSIPSPTNQSLPDLREKKRIS